jgi:hydroxymethylglutaryl-CoA reductase (NADPH)
MQTVGPIKLSGDIQEEVYIPLATYETPLWASTQRGAKISRLCPEGITVTLLSDSMTRSIILEALSAQEARAITKKITLDLLKSAVQDSSQHACLINIQPEILGKLIYLRLVFTTGEASGHNMVTKASDFIIQKLLSLFPSLSYISISGNICCDKKTSAINSLLGRGKSVIAEIIISPEICAKFLKTSPEKIVELNIKKNLLGSILAGSLRSANAHYANVLLAAYLATGQDAANIVEGSQGITHAELLKNNSLYFSIKIPNLIFSTNFQIIVHRK